jgi:hypothetical protein
VHYLQPIHTYLRVGINKSRSNHPPLLFDCIPVDSLADIVPAGLGAGTAAAVAVLAVEALAVEALAVEALAVEALAVEALAVDVLVVDALAGCSSLALHGRLGLGIAGICFRLVLVVSG